MPSGPGLTVVSLLRTESMSLCCSSLLEPSAIDTFKDAGVDCVLHSAKDTFADAGVDCDLRDGSLGFDCAIGPNKF